MISFHKLALVERDLLKDPKLRLITIGALLYRFSVCAFLKMKRKSITDRPYCPTWFHTGYREASKWSSWDARSRCNPDWCLLQTLQLPTHTKAFFYFLIQIFIYIYGDKCHPQ